MRAQEERRPRAAGDENIRGSDVAPFGPDAADPTAGSVKHPRRAILDDRDAFPGGQASDRRHGNPRLGPHVRRGYHSALVAPRHGGDQIHDLIRVEEACVDTVCAGDPHERSKRGHLRVGPRKVCDPGLPQTDILAALFGKLLPELARFDHDRQFVSVAALLPDPTPVAR